MSKINQKTLHAKMPITQLHVSFGSFAEPVTILVPDARLHGVAHLLLQGLVAAESPLITQTARGTSHHDETILPKHFPHWEAVDRQRVS